jgi:hypothetical protein
MTEPIKVMVGPSAHYHQLKSGQIKYQKSKPVKPIWRILIIDESQNRMFSRALFSQPSADEIEQVVFGALDGEDLSSVQIVIPATVEKLCPGLQEMLMAHGISVFVPAHGFASGSRAGREWEKFLSSLEMSLNAVRESMASCEEIASASGHPSGMVTSDLWRSEHKESSRFSVAYDLADKITRFRGRDPEVGRKTRMNESYRGPLNRGAIQLPQQDVLSEILRDPDSYLMHERWGESIWNIVLQLKKIRDAESEQHPRLIAELGVSAVLYQIDAIRNNRTDFLSSLGWCLSDTSLRYKISLGMKEAFKQLIVLNAGLLQVSAAKVTVQYPKGCDDLSLRGIPAHHLLEKMIQVLTGGRVAIIPDLTDIQQKVLCHPVTPVFLRTGAIFNFPSFSYRTPFSPAQCLISTAKAGAQRLEGLLMTLAILPKDTERFVPIGDTGLAKQMTEVINERLARNGKGITCQIGPLETYGDFMEIGQYAEPS